jgi:hypothetical protein
MNEKEFGEFKDDVIQCECPPGLTCEFFGCCVLGFEGRERALIMAMRMWN